MFANNLRAPKESYRPDIDGLRAVAVLAVLLFHLGVGFTSGGYVGVDVFFVISGFLITRLVVAEKETTGHFDFANFYARRIRRLFPALFVTVAATFVVSAILLSSADFESMARSAWAAVFSGSNILFWSETGYFDTLLQSKPLLHTWSLSAEEQFYFIWPAFIILSMKLRRPWIALGILGVLSFGANFFFSPDTIFYLTPFRAFEFCLGAAVAWTDKIELPNWIKEVGLLIGLAMIGIAIVLFDPDTVFPSYNALLPCIGAALVVQFGTARYSSRLLTNAPSRWIGLISYSIYLVHWPLIVLYRYWKFSPLTHWDRVALVAMSLALAAAMYFLVEMPFRRRVHWTLRRLAPMAVALAAAITLPAVNAAQAGWPWRANGYYSETLQARETTLSHNRGEACRIEDANEIVGKCRTGDKRTILIAGDSHADAWYYAFSKLMPDTKFVLLSYLGCDSALEVVNGVVIGQQNDAHCEDKAKFLNSHKSWLSGLSAVILGSYRPFSYPHNLFRWDLMRYLTAGGANGFVMGDYFDTPAEKPCGAIVAHRRDVSSCFSFADYLGTRETVQAEPFYAAHSGDYPFIDVASMFCPTGKDCAAAVEGVPALSDTDHLTFTFAAYLLKTIMTKHGSYFSSIGLTQSGQPVADN